MSSKGKAFVLLHSAALLLGCSQPDPSAAERSMRAVESARRDPPVLGKVRTRDHVLTLTATGAGPHIDIRTAGGELIARDVDPSDLDRHVPGLEDVYRQSTAFPLDARVDPVHLRELALDRSGMQTSESRAGFSSR